MCKLPSDIFAMISSVAVTVGVRIASLVAVKVAEGSGVEVAVGGGGVLVAEGSSTIVGTSGSGVQAAIIVTASANMNTLKICFCWIMDRLVYCFSP